MRVDVKKFLFVGLESDRKAFFKDAQAAGLIHFINTNPSLIKEMPTEVAKYSEAIKVLRSLPTTEQEETDEYFLAEGIVTKILQLKEHLEKLEEDERLLNLEAERVEIFGDFSLEDIRFIEQQGHCKIQFFCAPGSFAEKGNLPEELIYVGSEHELDYFVAINKEPTHYHRMVEIHIERPIGLLKKQIIAVKKEFSEIDHRLKTYGKYNRFLHHALIDKLNVYHLHAAENYAEQALDQELFAVEGWVSVDQLATLHQFMDKKSLHIEEIAIGPNDHIPTALVNHGVERVGEDLVHIYDTPSHTDKDPSLWVLFSFAFFFSMIVGDAGYGLVFLATALWIRYKHKQLKGLAKRVWVLMVILCMGCMIWGTLTTSFFGISLSVDSPIRKISLINWLVEKKAEYHFSHQDQVYKDWVKMIPNLKDAKSGRDFIDKGVIIKNGEPTHEVYSRFADQIMMEIALMIGVIHISLSYLRYIKRNWVGVGWIIFMIGCYLYFPYFLDATSIIHFVFGVDKIKGGQEGLYLIEGGFALAIFLSIIKNKLLGLLEVMTVIQIFADVMSYLRLYALGLAGGIVMATINEFAGALPFVFGALLFVIGHLTNMVLGIMGGVIHGLRLNFIEWYHYSFEGGGKMFNPLRLLKIE